MQKAWSLLEVKQVEDEARIIRGIATSPTPDRVGDVVVPSGAIFRGPIKLHLYHKHDMPVGLVEFGKATSRGLPFTATIPDVQEAGVVHDRVNEAWHSVKYRLLDAVSIGFKVLEDGAERIKTGWKFNKWEMLELSLVGVPANPEAVITAFKSCNADQIRSALGVSPLRLTHGGQIQLVKAIQSTTPSLPKGAVRLVR